MTSSSPSELRISGGRDACRLSMTTYENMRHRKSSDTESPPEGIRWGRLKDFGKKIQHRRLGPLTSGCQLQQSRKSAQPGQNDVPRNQALRCAALADFKCFPECRSVSVRPTDGRTSRTSIAGTAPAHLVQEGALRATAVSVGAQETLVQGFKILIRPEVIW